MARMKQRGFLDKQITAVLRGADLAEFAGAGGSGGRERGAPVEDRATRFAAFAQLDFLQKV